MKSHAAEMVEGPEAFARFRAAVKHILSVPKNALPPSPFGARKNKKVAPKKRKSSAGN